MVICMIIAFTLATRWFRRSLVKLPKPFDKLTGFNAFWYSHHLFIVVYLALIVHGQCLYLIHDWYRKTVRFYLFSLFSGHETIEVGFLRFLHFYFDADMDVSGGSCLLVSRGEGPEVLQVWQLFCQTIEGRSKRHENLTFIMCAATNATFPPFQVAIYPGNVLTLQMSKPPGFRYKSGQYMFVQCPAVSPFEW